MESLVFFLALLAYIGLVGIVLAQNAVSNHDEIMNELEKIRRTLPPERGRG